MNASGDAVGGALGFIRAVRNLVVQFKPETVYVAWEQGGGCPRRRHLFPGYKANRVKSKEFNSLYNKSGKFNPMADQENKARQLLLLSSALGYLPVCQLFVEDVEADDVIAWLVKDKLQTRTNPKIVVSTDKDFYQLLEDQTVRIFNPGTKNLVTQQTVQDQFSLSPRNITLARSVVGDNSDNIDGVSGVGLKTVAKWFQELSSDSVDYDIDWLMQKTHTLLEGSTKPPKCLLSVAENESVIRRNWQLMYLGGQSLSQAHLTKLHYRVDEFKPTMNYLAFLKVFTATNVPVTRDLAAVPTDLKFLISS